MNFNWLSNPVKSRTQYDNKQDIRLQQTLEEFEDIFLRIVKKWPIVNALVDSESTHPQKSKAVSNKENV